MHDISPNHAATSTEPRSNPPRLGHLHLKVRSLDRATAFYRRVLGLEVTERIGDAFVFLSSSEDHHTLALQAVGEEARPAPSGSTGLYHFAFEITSAGALRQTLARLDESGIPWQAVDHGISWAVYFDDPDGNGLEIYLDRRDQAGGRRVWHGRSERLSRQRIRRAADGEEQKGSDGTNAGHALRTDEVETSEQMQRRGHPPSTNDPRDDEGTTHLRSPRPSASAKGDRT